MVVELVKDFSLVASGAFIGAFTGNLGLPIFIHMAGHTMVGRFAENAVEFFRPTGDEPLGEYFLATKVGTIMGGLCGAAFGLKLALG